MSFMCPNLVYRFANFACDNNVFVEFHPNVIFLKDNKTNTLLAKGRCMNVLNTINSPATKAELTSKVVKLSSKNYVSTDFTYLYVLFE